MFRISLCVYIDWQLLLNSTLPTYRPQMYDSINVSTLASAGAGELLRHQNSDKMNLERELLEEERKSFNTKIQTMHTERQRVLDEGATKLAEKLQGNEILGSEWCLDD